MGWICPPDVFLNFSEGEASETEEQTRPEQNRTEWRLSMVIEAVGDSYTVFLEKVGAISRLAILR